MVRNGFTLVELLIVVLILGALAAIAVPRITTGVETAKINTCDTNIRIINTQIELYRANTGDWPNNIKQVTLNTDYFPDGPPQCPFGNPYTMQGSIHRVNQHNH